MSSIKIIVPKEFTVDEASNFREKTLELLSKGEINFEIDFKDCIFIDSTGLGVLVTTYKKCAELKGNIKLYSLNPDVMKVFKLTRLDKVFEIH
ncbi:MAG: STAS domain-containing protein [Clostridiaceae bacterium]|nr:STAS domain-containing protein [Clostridiaceae bacterium]